MADEQPIIIIKKKGAHAGHHGGAWKVAYADFVTAMMAFFMVMWLMNTTKPVKEAISGYFRDPSGTTAKTGGNHDGKGPSVQEQKKEDLSKVKDELMQQLQKMANFDKLKNQVSITLTDEGLKVEMREDSKGVFFENGDAKPTPVLGDILRVLSTEVGKLPNPVSIEGHTDATQYANKGGYSNWELSTDRANMARRIMETSGLRDQQVVQVRGYAANDLRAPEKPGDPSNRRVTVLIQYNLSGTPGQPGTVFDGKLAAVQAPAPKENEAPEAKANAGDKAAKGGSPQKK